MRSSGKIAIKKVNQRLEQQELQKLQPLEAYKFRVEKEVKGNLSCILCNKQISGKAYKVFIRLKGSSHRLKRSVLVCKECAKEEV